MRINCNCEPSRQLAIGIDVVRLRVDSPVNLSVQGQIYLKAEAKRDPRDTLLIHCMCGRVSPAQVNARQRSLLRARHLALRAFRH